MLNLNSLNPQQRQAVETVRGPVLILAGAGTGKTRVITCRIAHMIERGIPAGNILGVTFTNKAAREMQARVGKLIPRAAARSDGSKPKRPTVCTFHSLCVRILRQHIERLGYKRNFVIYDQSDQLSVVRKILAQISEAGKKADPAEVLQLMGRYKNGGFGRGANDPGAAAMAEIVSRKYESALRACNAVDFDDLLLLTLRLFREHPDALQACRDLYQYVMVDEYQDTNAAQFDLVHQLTREHRNLCVVGDDDQSIYGWRGAEIANLLDMEKHYPDVRVVKLEQNYRSTNTILRAANAVIQHNVRRRGKQLWSSKGDGEKITLQAYSNDEAEAKAVVEQIEYLRMCRQVPWTDQAILFRTNLQSRPIEKALRQASVRYHLIGRQSYFDRREVRDLLAYLKVFANPSDDVSLLRIANVPARGLSETTMQRLLAASQERNCPVFDVMKNPTVTISFAPNARKSVEQFVAFFERTRAQLCEGRSVSLQVWAEQFLAEIGYLDELRRSEKDPEAAESRIRSLKELVADLDGGQPPTPQPAERLQTFLEEVTLDSDREDEKETKNNAVTLITMHSCKGLEFPHVYIVGMEDGLLPHTRSKDEGTLDEERRLFYVAITRAKQTLTISHCAARQKYGNADPRHPSPFLRELPQELVELGDEKGKRPVSVESGKSQFNLLRDSLG